MRPDAPYFIILLCLMPDDFTRQGESAATQWVNAHGFVPIRNLILIVCYDKSCK
jgi:hypothetical protein